MKYRVYYRYLGAPLERLGGPWWYRDFDSDTTRKQYIENFPDSVAEYRLLDSAELPQHHYMMICPSNELIAYYP